MQLLHFQQFHYNEKLVVMDCQIPFFWVNKTTAFRKYFKCFVAMSVDSSFFSFSFHALVLHILALYLEQNYCHVSSFNFRTFLFYILSKLPDVTSSTPIDGFCLRIECFLVMKISVISYISRGNSEKWSIEFEKSQIDMWKSSACFLFGIITPDLKNA